VPRIAAHAEVVRWRPAPHQGTTTRLATSPGWLCAALAACHPAPTGQVQATPATLCLATTKPPPDSIPVAVRLLLQDSTRLVSNNSQIGGLWPAGFLSLIFRQDATLETRDSILRSIPACVVGGTRLGPDGVYLIALPQIATVEVTLAARQRLAAASAVTTVSIVGLGLGVNGP
jgi:hypothetical protein